MKNKYTLFLSLAFVLFLVLGCSFSGLTGSEKESTKDSSSKSADSEKSTDSETKTEAEPSGDVITIGIPECDEIATYINDNSEEIEGSYAARAIVYLYKNYILENIREGVEKMDDKEKEKWAKACSKSLEDLKKKLKNN